MGLDMYAYTTAVPIEWTDFGHPQNATQISYWRKHPNLHAWMEELYFDKYGCDSLNCGGVRLDPVDIDKLEILVREDALRETSNFIFEKCTPEQKAADVIFIEKARKAFAEGLNVFYTSRW